MAEGDLVHHQEKGAVDRDHRLVGRVAREHLEDCQVALLECQLGVGGLPEEDLEQCPVGMQVAEEEPLLVRVRIQSCWRTGLWDPVG